MKVDAIILGAELDSYLAAARLIQAGASVRLFQPGAGSLAYAPGGLRVLGYGRNSPDAGLAEPLQQLDEVGEGHPYEKVGAARLREALDWFLALAQDIGRPFACSGRNIAALSPAGLPLPLYASARHQASFPALNVRSVAVLEFSGHRDFPAPLVVAAVRGLGVEASLISVPPPGELRESVPLARSFDSLDRPADYFRSIGPLLPAGAEVVLVPAVLGLKRHEQILQTAEDVLGMPVLEVPTLPPSVPGLRLGGDLETWLRRRGALIHLGGQVVGAEFGGGRIAGVTDEHGELFEADAFVLATGGVLMGGLLVESSGAVREPIFGLDVVQTEPLGSGTIDGGLAALHGAGVPTDPSLRPLAGGSAGLDNLFVTGRMLADWNPAEECSAEGVSIGTGWVAAEAALELLGG